MERYLWATALRCYSLPGISFIYLSSRLFMAIQGCFFGWAGVSGLFSLPKQESTANKQDVSGASRSRVKKLS